MHRVACGVSSLNGKLFRQCKRLAHSQSTLPPWATIDPFSMSGSSPAKGQNLCNGEWTDSPNTVTLPDPMNGEPFMVVPDVQANEAQPYIEAMKKTPRTGNINTSNPYC